MNTPAVKSAEAKALAPFRDYDDTTYHGRAQLKPAPFENLVVGGYIFLAGTSGSSAILAAIADLTGDARLGGVVRRGRYLSLLAPTLGSILLIYDLHTPKRFYNMLRVAKATSPMSIGTWILMSFSGTAFLTAAAQLGLDLWPNQRWLKVLARLAGIPTALAGSGLSFYTAALMSATSTPVWAAAPQSLAVRYGASSIASASAALAIAERDPQARGKLDAIQAIALATEAVAAEVSNRTYRRTGVEAAFAGPYGTVEKVGVKGLGVLLPLGLLAASLFLVRRRSGLSTAAAVATIAGSAALRVSMLGVGDDSAMRPDVSFRFSTPDNLPEART